MSQFLTWKTIAKLDLIGCSWSHNSGIPALPGDAWNRCYHLNNSCPSNGWWQCKDCFQILAQTRACTSTQYMIPPLFFYILLTKWHGVLLSLLFKVEKAQVIDTFLFVAGINTLLQTWFGTRLPVVMGASYAFILPIISLTLLRRFSVITDPHQVWFNMICCCFFPILKTLVLLGQNEQTMVKENTYKCFVPLEGSEKKIVHNLCGLLGMYTLPAYNMSDVFVIFFRGLNKLWEQCKEHSLFHLFSKWLLDFLVSGESLRGRVLGNSLIRFEDIFTIIVFWELMHYSAVRSKD